MDPQIITRAERVAQKQKAQQEAAKANLPSRWQMLKNLVQAAGEVLDKGTDRRTPEEVDRVLEICAGCEKLVMDKGRARCGQCGCVLQYKSLLQAWTCPLGKW